MDEVDALIAQVNVALQAGTWEDVVKLTVPLYEAAVRAGETTLAELVQDLHWIANDALLHPVEVAGMVADVPV
jgi:hypothetical protein